MLIFVTVVGVLLMGLLGWSLVVRRLYGAPRRYDDVLFAVTDDHYRLPLSRYPPVGPSTRRHPVILCPGLGSNRYSFDIGEDAPSLAVTLAEHGFDVFVVELRGEGHGDHQRGPWRFDDFVERDVPALLARVRRTTGASAVHWVGHSMGGMVLLSAIARGQSALASGVTLGSALAFDGTEQALESYTRLRPLFENVSKVPYGWLSRLLAPASARRLRNPLDALNVNLDNCDPAAVRRLDAIGFTAISPDVILQLMTAVEPGGLRPNGEDAQPYFEQLAERDETPPVLMMAGEADPQCPFEAVERILRVRPNFVGRRVGPSSGAERAYGHFDLLMGRRADAEVFPHIVQWLDAHDGPAERTGDAPSGRPGA